MSKSKEIFIQVRSQELEKERANRVDVPAHLIERLGPLEVWKEIQGYEGRFMISDYGNVKSFTKKITNHRNKNRSFIINTLILKLQIQNSGYLLVHLNNKGQRKAYTVHRLVAIHFIPNPDNKAQVNHKDGNKLNNHVSNLEWNTNIENSRHSWDSGLMEKTREAARGRMSIIGKKYSKINGDRLKEYYAGSNEYNRKG